MTKARDLANIISGGFDATDIPNLDTSKITSGTFADARMPSTVLNSNVDLTNLSATNLTSGTLPDARFPATLPAVSGANLTGISAGNYSAHAFDTYNYTTNVGVTTSNDYVDISGGNYVSFTPTSTDDIIFFAHGSSVYMGANAVDLYLMMSTSPSIGSGDTKLNFSGRNANGSTSYTFDHFKFINKSFYLACTSLSVGTTYYVEQAAGSLSSGAWIYFNYGFTNNSGDYKQHNVAMIHYKKN